MSGFIKPWQETDVLVLGAGAAGWPAAIGAAREGATMNSDRGPFWMAFAKAFSGKID
jgi:hypothetical protein